MIELALLIAFMMLKKMPRAERAQKSICFLPPFQVDSYDCKKLIDSGAIIGRIISFATYWGNEESNLMSHLLETAMTDVAIHRSSISEGNPFDIQSLGYYKLDDLCNYATKFSNEESLLKEWISSNCVLNRKVKDGPVLVRLKPEQFTSSMEKRLATDSKFSEHLKSGSQIVEAKETGDLQKKAVGLMIDHIKRQVEWRKLHLES